MNSKSGEECCLLEKVMRFLEMPQIIVRDFEALPKFERFSNNAWVVGAFFSAFNQNWSVRFMWLTPPEAENEKKQAQLHCSFLFVLRLETPDTCFSPLGLLHSSQQ